MRTLKCRTKNVKGELLSRVVSEHENGDNRVRCAFLLNGQNASELQRYGAVLVSPTRAEELIGKVSLPVVIVESAEYDLRHNDVIRIRPNSDVLQVLFESQSKHNGLFLTERCNCRCIMCPQEPRADSEDYVALSKRTISLIKSMPKFLTLTGGEPTLLEDGLIEIVDECRQKLPDTRIVLLSNARKFADLAFVEKLAMSAQGMLAVAIPIYADVDTSHDRIVGVSGAFAETVIGAQNLALYRVPVEVRVVIMAFNYRRLTAIADFIYRNLTFAFHVAFMGLELQDLARTNVERVWIDPYDYQQELARACNFLFRRGLEVSIYNHQLCTIPRQLWMLSKKSISGWKNIYLAECEYCALKDKCGGFFASATLRHSAHITPMQIDCSRDTDQVCLTP